MPKYIIAQETGRSGTGMNYNIKDVTSGKQTVYGEIDVAGKQQDIPVVTGEKEMKNNMNESVSVPAASTKVQTDAEQFLEYLEKQMEKQKSEDNIEEADAKQTMELYKSLSAGEIEQLRAMQIDISSVSLREIMGLVTTMRSNQHQEQINLQLEAIHEKAEALFGDESGTKSSNAADNWNHIEDMSKKIEEILYAGNLPADNNQVNAVLHTLQSAKENSTFGYEKKNYIIQNQMSFQVDHLYKAQHSAGMSGEKEIKLEDSVWEALKPQAEAVLKQAEISVTEDSLAMTKEMLQHDIPVNEDSIRIYMAMEDMNQNGISQGRCIENIVAQLAKGEKPEGADVYYKTEHERAKEFMEKVASIKDSAIMTELEAGKTLTIYGLSKAQNNEEDYIASQDETTPMDKRFVKAKRQLEEIRLMLTLESATRLVKKDFYIDTRELSKVVDTLKEIENQYAIEDTVTYETAGEARSLINTVKALPDLPAGAIGAVLLEEKATIQHVYKLGNQQKAQLAGQEYEKLGTAPRRDMGDSIEKAFGNVDSILQELELEVTQANQRAVRILGYNQMELTKENIEAVKYADGQLNEFLQRFQPQMALQMIQDGLNPLNMPIEELHTYMTEQYHGEGLMEDQSYSEFLFRLEKNESITKEERSAYIGIYRLLHKLTTSKGKEIGTVVRNGQTLTLGNLLTANRSDRAKGMDIKMDADFGELTELLTEGESITDQINAGYESLLAGQIKNQSAPEIWQQMFQREGEENLSLERWKEEISREEKDANLTKEYVDEQMKMVEHISDFAEDAQELLQELKMPVTYMNLWAADTMLHKKGSIFETMWELTEDKEKAENQLEDIYENSMSKESLAKSYEAIINSTEEILEQKSSEGVITFQDLQLLKQVNAGMKILSQRVKQHNYQIPFLSEHGVQVINVSIVHDKENKGNVTASMELEEYGTVTGILCVEEDEMQLTGGLFCDTAKGNQMLKEKQMMIEESISSAGYTMENFVVGEETQVLKEGNASTRLLLQTAKKLVSIMRNL